MFKYVCVSLKCMCASLISGSLILRVGRRSSMKIWMHFGMDWDLRLKVL